MSIEFTKEQKQAQAEGFQALLAKRFDLAVDNLDAELAMKELTNTLGVHAYNHGVADAQAYLSGKVIDVGIDVYAEPEQKTKSGRQVTRKPATE